MKWDTLNNEYMLATAGKMAGPNWLTFLKETHGYPLYPGVNRLKYFEIIFFFKIPIFLQTVLKLSRFYECKM